VVNGIAPGIRPGGAGGPRRITILGATGSIGRSTVDLLTRIPGEFEVEAVVALSRGRELAQIARDLGARIAVVGDPAAYGELRAGLAGTDIEAASGEDAVEAAAGRPVDIVVAAIVGAAGLRPSLAALRAGSTVALANKECLVCAGDLFISTARDMATRVLPVDSEHNAIFQALETHNLDQVERIILTASGGPFRQWPADAMASISREQALNHPNWRMGPKVTIDSATLMNKGLEVIEAHHLFGLTPAQVEVLVHPQSVVHGIVAYSDGSMIAQMGAPDMRTPLAHCLWWPARQTTPSPRLDLARLATLTFETPDTGRFPALRIAREALESGGWATNILNAANEVAVAAFLEGRIAFLDIAALVESVLERVAGTALTQTPRTVDDALALDGEGRRLAQEGIGRRLPV
jgi:1-deoxy-D-xylulose-5-phosphate reductoisomerase